MKSCCHCLHFSCWEEPLQHSQAIPDLGDTVCLPAHSCTLSSSPNSHLFHSLLILAALAPQPPTPKLLTHILSPDTTSFWPGSLQSASQLSVAQPEPAGAGSQAPKPCVKSLQGSNSDASKRCFLPRQHAEGWSCTATTNPNLVPAATSSLVLIRGSQGECPGATDAQLYTETLVWTLLRAGAE